MMYSRDLANDNADVMTTEAEYFASFKKYHRAELKDDVLLLQHYCNTNHLMHVPTVSEMETGKC